MHTYDALASCRIYQRENVNSVLLVQLLFLRSLVLESVTSGAGYFSLYFGRELRVGARQVIQTQSRVRAHS